MTRSAYIINHDAPQDKHLNEHSLACVKSGWNCIMSTFEFCLSRTFLIPSFIDHAPICMIVSADEDPLTRRFYDAR
eukprot:6634836-Pyramimonas_sp.AAC.1